MAILTPIAQVQLTAFTIGWTALDVIGQIDDITKPFPEAELLHETVLGKKWAVFTRPPRNPWAPRGPQPCKVCDRRFHGRGIQCGDCILLMKCPGCKMFRPVRSRSVSEYCCNACRKGKHGPEKFSARKKMARHLETLSITIERCKKHKDAWTAPHIGCMECYLSKATSKVQDFKFHYIYVEKLTGNSVMDPPDERMHIGYYHEAFMFGKIDSANLYKMATKMPDSSGVWSIWLGRELLDVAETINIRQEAMLFVRRVIHPDSMKYLGLRHRAGFGKLRFKVVKQPLDDKIARQTLESRYAMKHRTELTVWKPAPGQKIL